MRTYNVSVDKNGWHTWRCPENGYYHNLDGPAIVWGFHEQYWVYGRRVTEKDFRLLRYQPQEIFHKGIKYTPATM